MSVIAIFEFVLFSKIDFSKLKIKVLWYLGQWLIGVLCIFGLFNYFWNFTELSFHAFGLMALEVALVMVVPISIRALSGYFLSKENMSVAEISNAPERIRFTSENEKEELILEADDFVYLAAAANYVEVYYLKNGVLEKRLLRTTLKRIEDDSSISNYLLRLHRSYIVNPQHIKRVEVKKGRMITDLGQAELKVSPSFEEHVRAKTKFLRPKD